MSGFPRARLAWWPISVDERIGVLNRLSRYLVVGAWVVFAWWLGIALSDVLRSGEVGTLGGIAATLVLWRATARRDDDTRVLAAVHPSGYTTDAIVRASGLSAWRVRDALARRERFGLVARMGRVYWPSLPTGLLATDSFWMYADEGRGR